MSTTVIAWGVTLWFVVATILQSKGRWRAWGILIAASLMSTTAGMMWLSSYALGPDGNGGDALGFGLLGAMLFVPILGSVAISLVYAFDRLVKRPNSVGKK